MKDKAISDLEQKAIDQLISAAGSFMHQQVLIQKDDISKPEDITRTAAYRALKDACTHARFVLRSGAADDMGAHAEQANGATALQGMDLSGVATAMEPLGEVCA